MCCCSKFGGETRGAAQLGVILTGMGSDGAAGMLAMYRGWRTDRTQNEASCVVISACRARPSIYGGVSEVVDLSRVSQQMLAKNQCQ